MHSCMRKAMKVLSLLHGIEPDLLWASIMSTTHFSPSLTSPPIFTSSGHNEIFDLSSSDGIYTITISNIQHYSYVCLD